MAGTSSVIDTHVHVMDPRFPFAPDRAYTPGPATMSLLRQHLGRVHADRVVLVQPSAYGTDHGALLDALTALEGAGRGVAVVASDAAPSTVRALKRGGVVGLRLNAPLERRTGAALADRFADLVRIARRHDLHVSVHAPAAELAGLAAAVRAAGVPVIFEHYALLTATARADTAVVDELLALVRDGVAWVKLSGISKVAAAPCWSEATALIRTLAAVRPDRLMWGSDWPHTSPQSRTGSPTESIEPFETVNDAAVIDAVRAALPAAAHDTVLTATARAVYHFH
jgi:predicted TIM-barrel fold metal-dependent hydrolase